MVSTLKVIKCWIKLSKVFSKNLERTRAITAPTKRMLAELIRAFGGNIHDAILELRWWGVSMNENNKEREESIMNNQGENKNQQMLIHKYEHIKWKTTVMLIYSELDSTIYREIWANWRTFFFFNFHGEIREEGWRRCFKVTLTVTWTKTPMALIW